MTPPARGPKVRVVPVFLPPSSGAPRLIDPPARPGVEWEAWAKATLSLLSSSLARIGKSPVQLAFFGSSFGSVSAEVQQAALALVNHLRDASIEGLRVVLDPPEAEPALLERLSAAGVHTVELDAGSFDDEALTACGMPWSGAEAEAALERIKAAGFESGVVLRPGMPGGNPAEVLRSARAAIERAPSFVRIYPVLVLERTALAEAFRSRRYRPMSLEEAVETCQEMLRLFGEAGVNVSRVGFQPAVDLPEAATVVAGPWHPSLRSLAEGPLWLERASRLIVAHFRFQKELTLVVAPCDESRVRGLHGMVVRRLREKFRLEKLHVRADPEAAGGSLALELVDAADGALRRVAG